MPTINKKISMKTGDSLYYSVEYNSSSAAEKYSSIYHIKTVLGRSTIYPRFRIFMLNPDETVWFRIPNEDIIVGGSYNENYQNGSRRTLSFSVYNDTGKYTPSVDKFWAGSKIALEIGIEVPDDYVVIWFKRGVFVMNAPQPSKTADSKTVSFECEDKYSVFSSKLGTISTTLEIPVGSTIQDIINDVLQTSKGNGQPLDPKPMRYDMSFIGKKTPMTISLSAGDTYDSLFSQLCQVLSAEIFYDFDGHLVVAPIVETMSDGDKPVLYDYDKSNLQSENFSFDTSSFVNCVQVVGANVNGHTCIATAKNEDPSSPISIQKIGLRTNIVNDSNITTDILAQERADYELRKVIIAKSVLSSSVFFNPLLSVNNLVTYTDPFFELRRDRFLIQSVSFSLDYSGLMSLSVSNINNLPFIA